MKAKYDVDAHGNSQCWVVRGSVAKAKKDLTLLERDAARVDRLRALFTGKQNSFSPRGIRYLSVGKLFGYGCSDECAIRIMEMTSKAICYEMRMTDITNEGIAKGIPSRETLRTDEKTLAVDTKLKDIQQMIDDRAKHFGLLVDHRN